MLDRLRAYSQEKPLQAWLSNIAFLALFNTILAAVFYGYSRQPFPLGMLFVMVSMTVMPPTTTLIRRFSNEERCKIPVAAEQAVAVGKLGVALGICSILSFGSVLFGKQLFGASAQNDAGFVRMILFSFCAVFSLALGYAVRYTRWGRTALGLTLGWLSLLVLSIPVLAVSHLIRDSIAR